MRNNIKEEQASCWHTLTVPDLGQRLHSSSEGLTSREARNRLNRVGANSLETGEGVGPLCNSIGFFDRIA